jgi:AcrR family transcriptional regulator
MGGIEMENQRIRLSKKMLKDSLIRLLQKGDIQHISIQEICQEAQINRTTFYKYYGSQYELLNDIEKDVFSELETRLVDCDTLTFSAENDGLTQTLTYFEEEREKCLMLINSTTDKAFAENLFQLPVIQNLIKENTPLEFNEIEAKYMHIFMTHGGYAMIRQWANSECRESPKEMSLLMRKIISKLLM